MEARINHLRVLRAAIQARRPDPPRIGLIERAISLMIPVAGALWSGLAKLGFVWAPPFWVTALALALGAGFLLKRAYRKFQPHLYQAKIEEQTVLIEQIDGIIHTFEKMEEKMSFANVMELRSENQKFYTEAQASQKKMEDTRKRWKAI